MPAKLHRELTRRANRKGLKGRRRKAYIYGTLMKVKKKRGY